MTSFKAWYEKQPRGTAARFDREGIAGHTTIHKLRHGGLLRDYAQAKRVSAATGGVVSIQDLCEPPKKRGAR